MSFDKGIILAAVAACIKAAGSQQKAIVTMLDSLGNVPHESRINICAEAVKSIDRKENPTGYQYASRMKAIVGAAFLVKDFKVEGGVNAIYSAAVKALGEAGLNPDGTQVSVVKAQRLAAKVQKREAEVFHKLAANAPEGALATDVRAQAQVAVAQEMADKVLESMRESAEKFAAKMIENQGLQYAEEFAAVILAAVKAKREESTLKIAA